MGLCRLLACFYFAILIAWAAIAWSLKAKVKAGELIWRHEFSQVVAGNDCLLMVLFKRQVKRISMIERFRQWLIDLRTNRFAKYIKRSHSDNNCAAYW
jgi:hypothetical protein